MAEPTIMDAGLGSFLSELGDLCRRFEAEIVATDTVWLRFRNFYFTCLSVNAQGRVCVTDPFSNQTFVVEPPEDDGA